MLFRSRVKNSNFYKKIKEVVILADINYNEILNTSDLHVHEEMFAPIFYLKNYPLYHTDYSPNEREDYQYINGLKLANSSFFHDADQHQRTLSNFLEAGGIERYALDLVNVISSGINDKIILTCIPSSKIGKINIVTFIVEYLTKHFPEQFINGNNLFQKIENENTAHESEGNSARGYRNHYNSWKRNITGPVHPESVVIVVDDVLTTGSTFYAAHKHLSEIGYKRIVNFAFGRTIPNILLKPDSTGNQTKIQRISTGIDAIIFDLDQTIIDSRHYAQLNFESESYVSFNEIKQHYQQRNLFHTYDGIRMVFHRILCEKQIPLMIVTNRATKMARFLMELNSKDIFGYHFKTPIDPDSEAQSLLLTLNNGKKQQIASVCKNGRLTSDGRAYVDVTEIPCLLSHSDADAYNNNGKLSHLKKPSDNLVTKAKKIFEDIYERNDIRIIGVGNTEYDIMAYNKAGIESVLVNWGNLGKSENRVYADYVFEDVESFTDFVMRQ